MKLFRYYFQNKAGNYLYVDGTGVVNSSSSPIYMEDDPDWLTDPDGINTFQVAFNRNEEKGGVFRSATIPLKFHSKPGLIIRSIYYTAFVAGYLKVTIEKQNRDFDTNDWLYQLWYSAELDFGSIQDGDTNLPPEGVYITGRLIELGITALLEAGQNTPYEIPIYTSPGVLDSDAVPVRVGGISLKGNYRWVIPETVDADGDPYQYEGEGNFPVYTVSEDTIFDLGEQQSSDRDGLLGLTFFNATYTYEARLRVNAIVNYYNDASGSTPTRFTLRVLKYLSTDLVNLVSATTIYSDPTLLASGGSRTITIATDNTFTFDKGFAYRLDVEFVPSSGIGIPKWGITSSDAAMTIDAVYVMPDVTMHGFRYIDLANKLVDRFTNSTGIAVSNYLTAGSDIYNVKFYNCICVPGASIRKLDNPVIKTTFDELRQDLRTMGGMGVATEGNNIRLEPMRYYYQKNVTIHTLQFNGSVQKSLALDYMYNRIRIGFPDSSVDEINGLQEFCCQHVYSCGLISPGIADKELNLMSPYIHGMYSIANIIAFQFKDDETSSTKDNEVCVLEVEDSITSGAYNVRKGIIGGGVPNSLEFPLDAFNIGHSPKTCLIRQLDFPKSYLNNGHVITFQTATKNSLMSYPYNPLSTAIYEASDITITETGATALTTIGGTLVYPDINRIFKPVTFNTKGQMPELLLTLMAANPYGVISFSDNGIPLEGFVLDSGVAPDTEDAYDLRLLCSPDVDLTTLIHG